MNGTWIFYKTIWLNWTQLYDVSSLGHWCTLGGPVVLADFEIIPIEVVLGQIFWEELERWGGGVLCWEDGIWDNLG